MPAAHIVKRSVGLLAMMLPGVVWAQTPSDDVRIMDGFVPDRSRLEYIPPEQLKSEFADTTFQGLYFDTWLSDQRYVETTTPDGVADYREGDFESKGAWFVKGRNVCFTYPELPGQEFCHNVYRYGDCYLTYGATVPTNLRRIPLRVENWGAVKKKTDADFKWPDVAKSEVEPFTCRLMMS